MTTLETPPDPPLDLESCDREPIHVPGSVQPHGLLMVLEGPGGVVRRVSRNTDAFLGRPVRDVLGRPLRDVLGDSLVGLLDAGLSPSAGGEQPRVIGDVSLGSPGAERPYHAVAHRRGDQTLLEFEPAASSTAETAHTFYPPLQNFLARLDALETFDEIADLAAREVRGLTGFDRVLVYRFDADGHGTVVAESRNDRLPAYLGQRFPASDIPRQARELYKVNRLRLIPDARYDPVPIVPADGEPVDLTCSTLRSVSPVHVEYMRNMGTAASMSVSILRGGELWGLISCHHATPRFVPFGVRAACDLLAQGLSIQVSHKEQRAEVEHRLSLGATQTRLVESLTEKEQFVEGLTGHADDLMTFAGASGVAILFGGVCSTFGETPDEAEVRRIADWLAEDVGEDVFVTDSLPQRLPWTAPLSDRAAGLLAVSISKLHRNYLLWFRKELLRTVVWAGDPSKPAGGEGGAPRLHPRRSFEAWKEIVRGRSAAWRPAEVEAAAALRNAIVGVVLRRAEELASLNAELQRSNQELEAFSYSVSHDLRAPFRHIVGYAELLREGEKGLGPEGRRYVDTIIESARYAGTLVDNLLSFSRMGRMAVHPVPVDMNALVAETVVSLSRDTAGRKVTWKVADLPPSYGDLMMVRQAVANLLGNAVKYTRGRDEAVIEVTGRRRDGVCEYTVRDNGVGFDMRYSDKLFGVFQRLHRIEDFEGTGIGLANVRRIVTRHGGKAWAEGRVGAGATFHFTLPEPGSPGYVGHAQADTARRG